MASLVTTIRYLTSVDFNLSSDLEFRFVKRDRDLRLVFDFIGDPGSTVEVRDGSVVVTSGVLADNLELDISALTNDKVYTLYIINAGIISFLEVHMRNIESR